ncbi:class I SAM-dependent methyltransferase [Paenibacillus oenotherae]|uniref:Class I SAM-dependent methyltransferase n=1 Tax=Paenibacillus oenotherae TaxID=1435645 RepID=A0ABS7DCZ7_9BACL|nr:class I SAM-dependent methyltransferase [Paenibacillus oenotherae]MBW7477817.1 class I SAM-dependent methyltransferase [Paenibacillus oenotherae]
MIITTAHKPSPELLDYAGELSRELGGQLVPRKQDSLARLKARYGDGRLLVADDNGLRYYEESEEPLYFHPSMAYVRVKRMRSGERDPLIEVSDCTPGDTVLDCTAGLGSDAIVFSYAAGAAGHVTALESEPVLCAVVREGLRTYETIHADVNEAFRRIKVECANHMDWLSNLPDKSVDIVYFDPMFRRPMHDSTALAPLRGLANNDALLPEAIHQALRVARKSVVLKEHKDSGEFRRLGFERRHVNKIAYGVINPT